MPQDPRLAAAAEASRAASAQAVTQLRAMAADIKRDHAQFKRERDQRNVGRADAARSGEAGPEAQEVQLRIDRGETTWDDVLQGRDDHPSARAVQARMRSNLDDLATRMRDDPEFVEQQAEAEATQATIEAETRSEEI